MIDTATPSHCAFTAKMWPDRERLASGELLMCSSYWGYKMEGADGEYKENILVLSHESEVLSNSIVRTDRHSP